MTFARRMPIIAVMAAAIGAANVGGPAAGTTTQDAPRPVPPDQGGDRARSRKRHRTVNVEAKRRQWMRRRARS